jgi:hypothetical protein
MNLAADWEFTRTRTTMSDEKPKKATRGTRARKRTGAEAATAAIAEDLGSGERVVPVPQTSEINDPASELLDAAPSENTEEEIRLQAYELYLSRGGANGDDLSDWLEAERLVRSRRNPEPGHAQSILSSEQLSSGQISNDQISSEQRRD